MEALLAAAASLKADLAANGAKQVPAAPTLSNTGYVPPNRRPGTLQIRKPVAAVTPSPAKAKEVVAHPLQAGSSAGRGNNSSSNKPAGKVKSGTQTSTPPELLDQHYLRNYYCSMKTFVAGVVQVSSRVLVE
jgi:hypothetical protein